MSDDDRFGHGASPGDAPGSGFTLPVVLPEHASVYYSPRSPPAVSSHRTIETAAVKLDSSLDPGFADTRRMSVDGLDPPPWLGAGSGPVSDAPTVLVPIVRARRFRKRVLAGGLAAVVGATLGIWFGLTRESPPGRENVPPKRARVTSAGPASAVPGPSVDPPRPASVAQASASAGGPSNSAGSGAPRPARRRPLSAPTAWLKAEPPKAWIK